MAMGKMFCEKVINGETMLLNLTTYSGLEGILAKTTPGVGKPFWVWPSIPAGKVIGCDFSNAPIATDNITTNNQLIAGITTKPEDVLIYEET